MGSTSFEKDELIAERFQVVSFLGRGAAGEAYLCRDPLLNRQVVCKIALQLGEAGAHEFISQFDKLHKMVSGHVVRPLGYYEHKERAIVVLEWIEGADLQAWARSSGLLERLKAFCSIVEALVELRKAKISHNDLHHGVNIIVNNERGVILIDPAPELWGSNVEGEQNNDAAAVASMIDILAVEYSPELSVARAALLDHGREESLTALLVQLRGFLSRPPINFERRSTFRAALASAASLRETTNSLYFHNYEVRKACVSSLAERSSFRAPAHAPRTYSPARTPRAEHHVEAQRAGSRSRPVHCVGVP